MNHGRRRQARITRLRDRIPDKATQPRGSPQADPNTRPRHFPSPTPDTVLHNEKSTEHAACCDRRAPAAPPIIMANMEVKFPFFHEIEKGMNYICVAKYCVS
jgi:hypothetical protein